MLAPHTIMCSQIGIKDNKLKSIFCEHKSIWQIKVNEASSHKAKTPLLATAIKSNGKEKNVYELRIINRMKSIR